MDLFEKHQSILENAIAALRNRGFYAQYPEHPGAYPDDADAKGRENYKALLGKNFVELNSGESKGWVGKEISPYTQEELNIKYPEVLVETLIDNSTQAFGLWRKATLETRAGILIESLERLKERFFEIAYATMHTTGQGYMMAFQASGPHAADRALEAIAAGYEEQKRFPEHTLWDKPMGKFNIKLEKEWKGVPKGIGVVIGCSTFPTWNSVTGIYADLITGNTVIVKPHPGAVLPIAIFVAEIRKVLKEEGFDPNICQLGVDTPDHQITKDLAEHPAVKLIDYTGNSEFGSYLEGLSGKIVFTEKTGVNSAILDSVENIDAVVQNLSFSLALYSGQMCTAPQNFFIPASGIKTPEGVVSFDEFAEKFVEAISGLVDNPKAGPFVLGAIQNPKTCDRVEAAQKMDGKIWLKSKTIENPQFKKARISTPVVVEVDASKKENFSKELFGPIALLIKTRDTSESVQLAKEMAIKFGAISCGAYTTNPEIKEMIKDEMSQAATPVSFNLVGGIYLNQHAGFSDFHVTGGNPAGNASFTNPEYVIKRFVWVGFREPAKA
jgi:phenylacetic acid degradation protein paaN